MPSNIPFLINTDISLSTAISGADQIARRLRNISLISGPDDDGVYFYTRARVKSRKSIYEKVSLKRRESKNASYSFKSLTDLVGFRIVTLFDDQLEPALNTVFRILKTGHEIQQQPLFDKNFFWNDFYDARFVPRTTGQDDPYLKCWKQYIQTAQADFKNVHPDSSSIILDDVIKDGYYETNNPKKYSSIHLTFYARAYINSMVVSIPIEFQIRTVSDDLWGEINHKFLYKIADPFAWHPKYARAVSDAKRYSDKLKTETDNLSEYISAFRKSSNDAADSLKIFKFAKSNYSISVCLSICDEIGWDYSPHFVPEFDNCNEIMLELHRNLDNERYASNLCLKLIKIINPIISRLIEVRTQYIDPKKIEYITNSQKILILQLEVVRLKTIITVVLNNYIADDGKIKRLPNSEKSDLFINTVLKLYRDLCNIAHNEELIIRPMTMIYYWKYLLSGFFDDTLSQDNLKNADEILYTDTTIPSWSIYYILIPKMMATRKFLDAKQLVTIDGSIIDAADDNSSAMGLLNEARRKFDSALLYAFKAYEKCAAPIPESERRGDIIFGFGIGVQLQQAFLILEIVWEYYKNFHELPISKDKIASRGNQRLMQILDVWKYAASEFGSLEANVTDENEDLHDKKNLIASISKILK